MTSICQNGRRGAFGTEFENDEMSRSLSELNDELMNF